MKTRTIQLSQRVAAIGAVCIASLAFGQGYDMSWHTVDGGGATFSTGGAYSLGGTIGQHDAGAMSGGSYGLVGGFWAVGAAIPAPSTTIVAANPPLDNPFVAGQQPFRDVLQTGPLAAITQGIGAAGTPAQDTIVYAPISVTFAAAPSPLPTPANTNVACTGGSCPTVTSINGVGAGPYQVGLSGPIPPGHCATITFTGAPGQKLQYQSLPGDTNLSGSVSSSDVLLLVTSLNNGQANQVANLPRYNINRASVVTPTDVLRLVQLLNGTNASQVWLGTTVAACD